MGHIRTIPGNKHAIFEVRSCYRFEAIYDVMSQW